MMIELFYFIATTKLHTQTVSVDKSLTIRNVMSNVLETSTSLYKMTPSLPGLTLLCMINNLPESKPGEEWSFAAASAMDEEKLLHRNNTHSQDNMASLPPF